MAFTPPRPVLTSLAGLLALNFASGGAALAISPITIYGTGQNLSPGSRDSNWRIIHAPTSFQAPATIPYDAYVLDPQPHTGPETINGISYNWISISPDGNTANSDSLSRNWIFAQTFSAAHSGPYSFDFLAGADNGITLFANGTPDLTDPEFGLTIIGGTQIGTSVTNFSQLEQIAGVATLSAGQNTLYAVLNDYGGPTSFLLANAAFTPPQTPLSVPAPLPLLGALAAFRSTRRLRKRRLAAASHFTQITLQPGPPSPCSASTTRST